MNDSRRRLVFLAVVYLAAVMVLVVHLVGTMVFENEVWTRRSYANRWAFRDVPTKRGSIRDRQGELLAMDEPTSRLEIHYRHFRRRHPCAVVVHAANLMFAAQGSTRRLTYAPASIEEAWQFCSRVPLGFLRKQAARQGDVDRERYVDLRFYLVSWVAGVCNANHSTVDQALREALARGDRGTLFAALDLDLAAARKLFVARLAELEEVAGWLDIEGVGLWSKLDAAHELQRKTPSTEWAVRSLSDNLPYDTARRLAERREWHPGLFVRPSVRRTTGGEGLRWDSFQPFLGRVTETWGTKSDKARHKQQLEQMASEFKAMAKADEDLSEELRDVLTQRLQDVMMAQMVTKGRVGRYGIEADQDARLRGNAGLQWILRGRQPRDLGLWSTFDVAPGQDVFLTVDLRLQNLLEDAVDRTLAGRPPSQQAAIAIVDPNTGDILAVASRPLPRDRVEKEVGRPETSIVWWGNGFIGSLAKPLLLAEQLDAARHGRPCRHIRDFESCTGQVPMQASGGPFPRERLRCDHTHDGLVHDPVASLGVSCNTFFFQVGEGLGWQGVKRAYARFGLYREPHENAAFGRFFQPYVPGLPARSYPDPSWGRSKDIQRRSIGYFVEANVLQLARAYSGLATGFLPELSLLRRDPEEIRRLPLDLHPDDLAVIRAGMQYSVERGTASKLELREVWAKTGTAEVVKRRTESGRIRTRNNAWLAGHVGDPAKLAFACVVYNVEEGGFGAKVAGPMLKIFLEQLRASPELAREYL